MTPPASYALPNYTTGMLGTRLIVNRLHILLDFLSPLPFLVNSHLYFQYKLVFVHGNYCTSLYSISTGSIRHLFLVFLFFFSPEAKLSDHISFRLETASLIKTSYSSFPLRSSPCLLNILLFFLHVVYYSLKEGTVFIISATAFFLSPSLFLLLD